MKKFFLPITLILFLIFTFSFTSCQTDSSDSETETSDNTLELFQANIKNIQGEYKIVLDDCSCWLPIVTDDDNEDIKYYKQKSIDNDDFKFTYTSLSVNGSHDLSYQINDIIKLNKSDNYENNKKYLNLIPFSNMSDVYKKIKDETFTIYNTSDTAGEHNLEISEIVNKEVDACKILKSAIKNFEETMGIKFADSDIVLRNGSTRFYKLINNDLYALYITDGSVSQYGQAPVKEYYHYQKITNTDSSTDDTGTDKKDDTVVLSGKYNITEASSSTITFNNSTWTYSYNGRTKTGSYSQTDDELTMNFTQNSITAEAVFTVSKSDDEITLTAKSGDYTTIITSAFMITDTNAVQNGIVTLKTK